MSTTTTITIACPACGLRRNFSNQNLGEKVQCDCGMSYSVSPVFAVIPGENRLLAWFRGRNGKPQDPPKSLSWWQQLWGLRRARLATFTAALAIFAGSAGLAYLLMNQPFWNAPEPSATARTIASTESPNAKRTEIPPLFTAGPVADLPSIGTERSEGAADSGTTANSPTGASGSSTSTGAPGTTPSVTPALPPMKTEIFWDAFDLDPSKARSQYVGQSIDLIVRGKVERDSSGRAYFGARVMWPKPRTAAQLDRMSSQQKAWERDGYPANIRCYLAADQISAAEQLSKNYDHAIRGVCVGREDDSNVYMGYVVILRECRLVK